jgi:hypothetical protein
MDRETKDQIAKALAFAVGAIIAIYVFLNLLPYLVMFLALCGAWYLWQEYERSKRHKRDSCRERRNRRWF